MQFDICFYFVRHANENIDKFTKDTLKLETDQNTRLKYIRKVIDERTKNHQNDTEMTTAFMPEMPKSDHCPVQSFMFYMTKVHPRCDDLWQQVKNPEHLKNLNDTDTWYKPQKIGTNPLAAFISHISHEADLSRVYTNHSIRVTGTTLLGRCNYSAKQTISVTGHRSANSLSVYQKVSENEKLIMGMSMTCYLQSDIQQGVQQIQEEQVIRMPTAARKIAPRPSTSVEHRPNSDENQQRITKELSTEDPILQEEFSQELDFDVNSLLQQIEEENIAISQNVTAASTTTTSCRKASCQEKSQCTALQ